MKEGNKIWVTRAELRQMIREAAGTCDKCGKPMDECPCGMNEGDAYCDACDRTKSECVCESVNPWAVCTASTGTSSGKKRERCIQKVKKQQGMKR